MAMKMRQSLAQLEQEFWYEAQQDRRRQERLARHAQARIRLRFYHRRERRRSTRFWLLVLSLIVTAVGVTAGMFATLYYLLS
jgi:hypothetical protein